jgi:hypothetical protein
MSGKCHLKTLQYTLAIGVFLACFTHSAVVGRSDELNTNERTHPIAKRKSEHLPKGSLPSMDQLIEAKLTALQKQQREQEQVLAETEYKFLKEQGIEKSLFDSSAYLSLSIINSAPPLDYGLEHTEIYVDGKLLAQGGKRNRGLPRKTEIFFGPVEPGCHDILVKGRFVRLKNDLISRFKVNRIEKVSRSQTVIAKNGYHVEVEIEGFEAHNTFVNFYRGPAFRFNKSVRPNFLPGTPLVSLNSIFEQGRVHIDYITEDISQHRLIEKSISIDGLPVLVKEQHDPVKDKTVIFDAPLAQGKHILSATLVFGEKKWIGGGPLYNFRLTFDRDFYVISGETTIINLAGMPSNGFRSTPQNSRYARVTSKILSTENEEFFPENSCREIVQKQQMLLKQQQSLKPASNTKVE